MTRVPAAALRRAATLAAGFLLVAGLAHVPADADDTTPDALAGAPAVGSCYDLTLKDGFEHSVPKEPIDCAADHTTVVIEVGTLTTGLTWSSSEKAIGKDVGAQCGAAFSAKVGSKPAQLMYSQYTWFWFEPTDAEKAAGARWFSCHLAAVEDRALGDLPDVLPRAGRNLPDALARCFVGRKYVQTTCADRHDWRLEFAVVVHQKPTPKNIDRADHRICPHHVSTRTWLRSAVPLDRRSFVLGCSSKTHH
ncbi:hypothetical protein ASC77_16475 [Nocardioides sp. Root1257]|uniref:hypothetical protein n=1 Tax=unclassified Nocardioides TaxID=2615069 RepID=UPI0006FADC4F|nr:MULTISPECIES: hypothetical protein [unclassified Nocardioides]KQW47988.1 hypothetical protein ASC77_16475 [Nocardioides sp. Root1257]KRC45240.1 hypothetical protein ASE24_17425 [Nocardioides sp. Root224]